MTSERFLGEVALKREREKKAFMHQMTISSEKASIMWVQSKANCTFKYFVSKSQNYIMLVGCFFLLVFVAQIALKLSQWVRQREKRDRSTCKPSLDFFVLYLFSIKYFRTFTTGSL